ncbi:hypothetical protein SAMN05892883_0645 [Jatrophihabitans sp. GAS493]|uniref:hypothetical protein n=1 Tax=Jatrophihabitans sp. GAS493 TaxID=1907575 RepID=UPI000BC09939|nr:hypothetical protein [Jatrophihabitans sp. GAS493]SOD71045.1 hypothetical protein SAMN05892883_0645 [Jatrophihabitans sp. GAS493]
MKIPYQDFVTDGDALAEPSPNPDFTPNVVLQPVGRSSDWRAVWAQDANNGHEEFIGPQADVIEWASDRCPNVLIFSEEIQDLVPLRRGHNDG